MKTPSALFCFPQPSFPAFLIFSGILLFLPSLSLPVSGQDSSLDGIFDEVADFEISQDVEITERNSSSDADSGETALTSDDLDSFFDDAEDVPAETVTAGDSEGEKDGSASVASGGLDALIPQNSPLSFSGHLEAEVGLGYIWSERENSISGYFDFENDLNFSARTSKYLSVSGSIKTEFPNFSFSLSELYFDYLLLNKVYISGGKRLFRWGYIRLFDDDDEYDDTSGRFQPNILYDSDEGISARVIFPLGFVTFTGIGLYAGSNETPSKDEMSYAASIEMKLGKASLNIFGRSFPAAYSSASSAGKPPVFGIEAKRSFFGFDIYAQGQSWINSFSRLGDLDDTGFDTIVFTGGIMRVWDTLKPNVLLNFEYQSAYRPDGDSYKQKLAFLGAVSKIGKGEHVTIGVEWNHDITERCGDVTPGVIISGLLPHARWKNAVEIYYGKDENGNLISRPQVKLGTTIYLVMDY